METELFYRGIRPAVNVGTSVSRVGSAAQSKAMKQVAGSIKLELAQYREMEAFSQFASDLDASTRKLLERGSRLTELLKQPQNSPYTMEEEVVVLYAGTRGYTDEIPVNKIQEFEHQYIESMRSTGIEILNGIRDARQITKELEEKLAAFLKNFVAQFKQA